MRKAATASDKPIRKMRPALTPDAREKQLIALAMDLAEQRLSNGTASSQEVVHFLKAASGKNRLEERMLEMQVELAKAKTEAIQASQKTGELMEQAIRAMGIYSGRGDENDNEDVY